MKLVLIFAVIIMWYVSILANIKIAVHMLQLNSYRNSRYLKWIGKNIKQVFPLRNIWLLLPLVLAMLWQNFFVLIVAVLVYLIIGMSRIQKNEKKKLVYTMRVKRLFITASIILTILAYSSYLLIEPFNLLLFLSLLTLFYVIAFLIVLFANTINIPIEKIVSEYYYNDAKKIIESCKGLHVIAITGSYGKTSVKHFLYDILSTKYNVLMTPESYNTKLGVTITIRNFLKPYHDFFIVEMGAKQEKDIEEICDLVKQDTAVLSAIGEQHLDTFKTLDNIKKTKYEIVETLPNNGLAILNMDDENIMSVSAKNICSKLYYGINNTQADIQATNIKYSSNGMEFTVIDKNNNSQETFFTSLLGKHNIHNLLAGITVALQNKISLQEMKVAIKKIKPVAHRLELKKLNEKITLIDDAFNSNPIGSKMAIDVLGSMSEYKVLLTPGMIELGDREHDINKEFAKYAAKVCDYIILVGKKQTKPMQEGLAEINYPREKYYVATNLNEALQQMHIICIDKSVVLLENDLPDNYNE